MRLVPANIEFPPNFSKGPSQKKRPKSQIKSPINYNYLNRMTLIVRL